MGNSVKISSRLAQPAPFDTYMHEFKCCLTNLPTRLKYYHILYHILLFGFRI